MILAFFLGETNWFLKAILEKQINDKKIIQC